MDLSVAKEELETLVKSMMEEGILDYQFQQLQNLQDEQNPKIVAELTTLFVADASRIILLLGQYMSQNDVNFTEMYTYASRIKGSSLSVGARKIALASADLCNAVENKNKEMGLVAFNKIESEYLNIREKLRKIIQLENIIHGIQSNQSLHGGSSVDTPRKQV